MDYILIIGGKSDIGKAVAKCYAEKGYNLYLAARNCSENELFSNDLAIRYNVKVESLELDVLAFDKHDIFYENLNPKPVGVVTAVGYLDDQEIAQKDFKESLKSINTNFTGLVSLLNIVANDFAEKKSGFIIGISSVAGERGRQSNYIYGASKAAFSTYLGGLRNRMAAHNVQVLTVKPGFVATKMTQHLELPKALTASPEAVAKDILKAQQKGKNILYTKWVWRPIMLIISLIPEFVFKKLRL